MSRKRVGARKSKHLRKEWFSTAVISKDALEDDAPGDGGPTAGARLAIDELRSLVDILRHLDRAAAAEWDDAERLAADDGRPVPTRRAAVTGVVAAFADLGRRLRGEVRHVWAGKPRSILARLVITLGISLSLAAVYQKITSKSQD